MEEEKKSIKTFFHIDIYTHKYQQGEIYLIQEKVTDRDNALFEAGIKLGALYHQFTGSPVNLATVSSLEQAIQKSISVQPYVKEISVKIDREILKSKLNSEFGYYELQGPMLKVKITVKYGSVKVKVGMEYNPELNYPLMRIEEIEESTT